MHRSLFLSQACAHTHAHACVCLQTRIQTAQAHTMSNNPNEAKLLPAHIHVCQQFPLVLLRKLLVTFGAGEKVLLLAHAGT